MKTDDSKQEFQVGDPVVAMHRENNYGRWKYQKGMVSDVAESAIEVSWHQRYIFGLVALPKTMWVPTDDPAYFKVEKL